MRQSVSLAVFFCQAIAVLLFNACGGNAQKTSSQTDIPPKQSAAWQQLSLASGPSPRWGHIAVLDSRRRQAVIFGGAGGGSEIWLFSFSTQNWSRIDAADGPSPRGSPGAIFDADRDRLIVFFGTPGDATDEVWAFNFTTGTWSQLPKGPSPRFDIGSATDGTRAWIYGGFLSGFVATDELWEFELATDRWRQLPQSQVRPAPTTNMGFGFSRGSLYVTGGHDASGVTPGSWRYDLSTQMWTKLPQIGTPGAGAHAATDVDNACNDMILAGGDHDDQVDVSATDLFLLETSTFVRLSAMPTFTPRRHSALVLEPQSRTLLLFGGLQGSSQVLGDTWLLQLGQCP
jgi:hypothetical protein